MFFLYQIILTIIILVSPIIIIVRIFKNKEDKKRFIEKFSFFLINLKINIIGENNKITVTIIWYKKNIFIFEFVFHKSFYKLLT